MEIIIAIFLVLWAVSSVITYGAFLGYMQREFPIIAEEGYWNDVRHAVFMSLFPFAGLLTALALGRFEHGLMYKRPAKKSLPN